MKIPLYPHPLWIKLWMGLVLHAGIGLQQACAPAWLKKRQQDKNDQIQQLGRETRMSSDGRGALQKHV